MAEILKGSFKESLFLGGEESLLSSFVAILFPCVKNVSVLGLSLDTLLIIEQTELFKKNFAVTSSIAS